MTGFPSPFGGAGGSDGSLFDADDEFIPEHVPTPGQFLEGHDMLAGDDHVSVHRVAEALFEERGVYDMTFGYNLARLNLDTRHPDAGYRYAEQSDDSAVLRAEFTPTTPFCPQSDTLTKGSFRAWNGLSERHEYDLVRIRVAPMHHRSEDINDALEGFEERFLETGAMTSVAGRGSGQPTSGSSGAPDCSDGMGTTSRGPDRDDDPDAPF